MSNKSKASRLLSHYIRQIANEPTKPLEDADAEGGIRMATRAEVLARNLWKMAEGYEETVNGKVKMHLPNKAIIVLLLDRMEGRVPTIDAKDQKPKASVADKVGEQSRLRMNALVDKSDSNRSN